MTENRRRGFCFVGDAQSQIGLDQAIERLLRVAGRLEVLQHIAEPVDGGDVIVPVQIEPADRHFLARELVLGHLDLELGILDVFRVRIVLHQLLESWTGTLAADS